MSIFSKLPQDMLQHEINHFLDPVSRMAWNDILKKDEKVYRKFPVDYAIRHQIHTSHLAYQAITTKLMYYLEKLSTVNTIKYGKLASIYLKKFFAFFQNPLNQIVIMHVDGMKEEFMTMVEEFTQPDLELYAHLNIFVSRDIVLELRASARYTLKAIAEVPYIRKIAANKGFKKIYI
jgi:hypothetical protein